MLKDTTEPQLHPWHFSKHFLYSSIHSNPIRKAERTASAKVLGQNCVQRNCKVADERRDMGDEAR